MHILKNRFGKLGRDIRKYSKINSNKIPKKLTILRRYTLKTHLMLINLQFSSN